MLAVLPITELSWLKPLKAEKIGVMHAVIRMILRFLLDFNFFQKDENKPPITTVFVGNISDRAPDTMIRQVLQVSCFAIRVAVLLHRIVHFKAGS